MIGYLLSAGSFSVSELDIDKIIYSATPLNVSRDMIVNGNLDVTGILNAGTFASSELDVSGNSLMSGNLNVTGILTAGSFDVTSLQLNDLEITDNMPNPFSFPLNVSGNTRLYQPDSASGKALSVTGDTYMQGLVDIDGTLSASQLDVTRISTGTALEINTDLVVNGNMDATGTTHLTSLNTMQNALDVSGNSLMSGDLDVTGTLSTAKLTVSELDVNKIIYSATPLNVSRDTIVNGNLEVTGILNADTLGLSELDVSGNSLMSGNLNVTGILTAGSFDVTQLDLTSLEVVNVMPFTYPLDVSGNTRLYQPNGSYGYALSVTGNSYMEGNLSVSGSIAADMINVAHITYSATPLDVSRDIGLNGKMFLTPLNPSDTALNVYGNTEIYQPDIGYGYALAVTGHSFFDGNVNVSGNLAADMIDVASLELTSLDVSGNSLMSGDLDVTGTLFTANLTVSELDVNKIIYSATPLNVSRDTIVNGNLEVTGILNAGTLGLSELDVSGNSLMSGNLDVTGTLTTANLTVSELDVNEIIQSATPLNVSRNMIVNGDLDVTGILSAGYLALSELDVSGNSLMSGNLDVTGILTAGTLDVTSLSLSELEITDYFPNPFSYPLNVSGNTRLYQPDSFNGKALSVNGDTYMQGLVEIDGKLSANQLDVTMISSGSSLEINNDLVVNGNLDATGTTHLTSINTMQNALDVSGNSLMSGDLDVTGDLNAGTLKVSSTTFNTVSSQARNITFNDVSGTVMVTGFSSINSSTTLNASHNGVILASGTISLTLPDPTTVLGTTYTIKKTDSSANNVTIIGLVDNVNNPELLEQYSYITIVSDGSAWYKVAEFVAVPEVENPATIRNSLGMTFQLIPAGTFVMGSPIDELGRGTDESQYTVTLTESFYMQTTEVTQGQWEMVMNDNPSSFTDCGLNCPVEYISWEEAETFIINLNAMGEGSYTFPTEAQWEYAARSGSNKAFASGEISYTNTADPNLDIMGWYDSNSNSTPHAVAQKQANAWGLFDMHGNVWEFCNDWYDTYPTGSVTDPGGPSTGSNRVIRGGSWYHNAQYCRSAKRNIYCPGYRYNTLGLRLSRTL